jgi:branched-chain amino acid transport system substrate-binding protein
MRFRVVVAALAGLLILTACGGGDTGATGTETETGESTATADGTATDETAAAEDTAAEADGEPVRMGVVLPQAGVYGQIGPEILDGMNLYFDEVGRQAGGRPIELVQEAEPTDPNEALEATRRLVDQDVDLMTGYVSTAAAYAARDLLVDNEMVTLVSNAGGNDLTQGRQSEFIFRTSFTSDQVSGPLGTWVAENVGDRVAVVASDYAFGQESVAAFRTTFEEAGGEIVEEIFTPLGSGDFANAVATIAGADVDATFGFLAGSDGVIFVQQYAQAGLKESKPLTVAGFMVSSDVLDAVGDSALGAISSLHYAPTLDNPANENFAPAFEEAYGRQPSVYAVQGYDTAQYIVAALEATGGDTEPDALIAALEEAEIDSPRGEVSIDPETHQIVQHMYVREVQEADGRLTNVVREDLGEVGPAPLSE